MYSKLKPNEYVVVLYLYLSKWLPVMFDFYNDCQIHPFFNDDQ